MSDEQFSLDLNDLHFIECWNCHKRTMRVSQLQLMSYTLHHCDECLAVTTIGDNFTESEHADIPPWD